MKKTETDIVTIEVVSLATLMNGFQTKVIRVTLLMLISAAPSHSLFSFLKRNSDRREREDVNIKSYTDYSPIHIICNAFFSKRRMPFTLFCGLLHVNRHAL